MPKLQDTDWLEWIRKHADALVRSDDTCRVITASTEDWAQHVEDSPLLALAVGHCDNTGQVINETIPEAPSKETMAFGAGTKTEDIHVASDLVDALSTPNASVVVELRRIIKGDHDGDDDMAVRLLRTKTSVDLAHGIVDIESAAKVLPSSLLTYLQKFITLYLYSF